MDPIPIAEQLQNAKSTLICLEIRRDDIQCKLMLCKQSVLDLQDELRELHDECNNISAKIEQLTAIRHIVAPKYRMPMPHREKCQKYVHKLNRVWQNPDVYTKNGQNIHAIDHFYKHKHERKCGDPAKLTLEWNLFIKQTMHIPFIFMDAYAAEAHIYTWLQFWLDESEQGLIKIILEMCMAQLPSHRRKYGYALHKIDVVTQLINGTSNKQARIYLQKRLDEHMAELAEICPNNCKYFGNPSVKGGNPSRKPRQYCLISCDSCKK